MAENRNDDLEILDIDESGTTDNESGKGNAGSEDYGSERCMLYMPPSGEQDRQDVQAA